MSSFARYSLFLFAALLLLWALRAPLFRAVVSYQVIGPRPAVGIVIPSTSEVMDLDLAIDSALITTAAQLHFSAGHVSNDPRKLVPGSPANCIGYAALFTALLKGHLQRTELDTFCDVEAVIGTLHIGSYDLHSTLNGPFWRDHDIVRIADSRTGKEVFVDPTLYDVAGIGRVSAR